MDSPNIDLRCCSDKIPTDNELAEGTAHPAGKVSGVSGEKHQQTEPDRTNQTRDHLFLNTEIKELATCLCACVESFT